MSEQRSLIEETSPTDWETRAHQCQERWNRVFHNWKSFHASQNTLIKSYIGISLFGISESQDNVKLDEYFLKYDENRKNIINEIYKQLQFDNDRVILGQTYLHLSCENQQIFGIFRLLKPNREVHFIDINGRLYTSWHHFVETNLLRNCKFLAPDDGIHKPNANLKVYSSPGSSVIQTVGNVVAGIGTVGAIVLSVFPIFPIARLVLGFFGIMFSCLKRASSLIDRIQHNQSIGFNNMESVLAWLDIGASAFTGISTMTVLIAPRIIAASGKYSAAATTTLKALNWVALTVNVANLGAHSVNFLKKLKTGTLSHADVLELCKVMFMIYGAVINVEQMHQYLNSIGTSFQNSNTTISGISETTKQTLQRLYDEARNHTLSITGGHDMQNILEVSSWDMNLLNMASAPASILTHFLIGAFPSAYDIYYKCRDIVFSVSDYMSEKLTPKEFIFNMTNHVSNLYQIFKNDLGKIISTVKQFMEKVNEITTPQAINNVAEIIQNGVMAMNEIKNDLLGADPLGINGSAPDTDELGNSKPYFETILDAVEEQLTQVCSTKNTFEEVLRLYGKILSSICKRVVSKIKKDYEEMLSFNHKVIGEEKTKALLSKMGINSRKDYGNIALPRIIDEIKFHSASPPNPSPPTKILEELSVYRNFIFACSDVLNSDAEKTAMFLDKSVSRFIKPLTKKFIFVKTSYRNGNAHKFGPLLAALGSDSSNYANREPNDSMFFDIAFHLANILKFDTSSFVEMKENNEMDAHKAQEFSNDFITLHLLSLCTCFYGKVYPNAKSLKPECEKQFKKVCYFITNKFADTFKLLEQNNPKNISSKLEGNTKFFSKSDFIHLCQSFNEINKLEIFAQVREKFENKKFTEELIKEYHKKMDTCDNLNVEVWKDLIADDNIKIHTVDVGKCDCTRDYIEITADLYGIPRYTITVVSEEENLIILKTGNTFIMFQFEKSENIAFVMQVGRFCRKI